MDISKEVNQVLRLVVGHVDRTFYGVSISIIFVKPDMFQTLPSNSPKIVDRSKIMRRDFLVV